MDRPGGGFLLMTMKDKILLAGGRTGNGKRMITESRVEIIFKIPSFRY